MQPSTLVRLGAFSGALCGLFIAVPGAIEAFTGETAASSFVLGLSPGLAVPLVVALHLRHARTAGPFGEVALVGNLIGLGLFGGAAFTLNMALFYLDKPVLEELLRGPTRTALLGSAVAFTIGSVLFGIAMLRARVHPRIPAYAYTISLPAFALAAPLPDSPLTSALHVVVGVTIVWLATGLPADDRKMART
jgi:hypothetical protein